MKHLLPFVLLSFLSSRALAAAGGSFEDAGNTLVSAMMMFLGRDNKVYILDKAEGNAAAVNGHPAWGSMWDVETHEVSVMDIKTNTFCSSGMHLPNGSFVTFGGNGAVSPGGNIGSEKYPGGYSAIWDAQYQDSDGSKSIRIISPCSSSDDFTSSQCQWFDNPDVLSMQKQRWYSAAEALANGTIVIIGGFQNGGYIARNYPNNDPTSGAELTYEFFPSNGQTPQQLKFLFKTSGLNAYPLTFLLSSGNMFLQANTSTMIWDYETNTETDLPDMPGGVVRVYPASAATAMLPMTPANNYAQTILFCGGTDMPDEAWGNFTYPYIETWLYPASADCQRITPEPADGSQPRYIQDDAMLEGRTMGQFIIMPDGKMLVISGGLNGTAGFGQATFVTPTLDQMPFDESFASGPVFTPAIYDPYAPSGSRWSNAGLSASKIARLYHSSAILLPDASILVAGSNPNLDVNLTAVFPTQYQAEKFYPPYFSASTRPAPSGMPMKLTYGGDPFDITVPANSYSGSSDTAANNTIVSVVRGGWTTHTMNMGQRFLQLNNTYAVNKDGSIVLHVAQMPPNPNLFQPGPALLFVVVNGIPSNGTYVIVGSGKTETQPTTDASVLPENILQSTASGSASTTSTSSGGKAEPSTSVSTSHIGLIAGIAGGVAALALLALVVGLCLARQRRARIRRSIEASKLAQKPFATSQYPTPHGQGPAMASTESLTFLNQYNQSQTWNQSTQKFPAYRDSGEMTPTTPVGHYQPYQSQSRY
ncbi:glyoxal oxidase N-terminus-domain-containing protein [Mycena sp. CBHHK59/15]|nr:glyoxal oxidase N-terminus-domain-containing protein [Mycena sp. CBHHK59/15]